MSEKKKMDLTTPMRRLRLELLSAFPIPPFAAGYLPSPLEPPRTVGMTCLSGSREARLKCICSSYAAYGISS